MRANRRAKAKHRAINNSLTVNRMGHRLTDLHVVKRRHLVVGGEDRLALGIAHNHLKARISFKLWHVLRRGIARKHIHIFRHHSRKRRRRVGDKLERYLIKLRRRAPVVSVLLKRDIVALNPVGKLERACADRGLLDVFDALWRDNHSVTPSQIEQKRAIRRAQSDLNSARVDSLNISNARKQCFLRIGAVFGTGAIKAKLDVFRVHGGAIMKGDPLGKLERIGHPVIRNHPALRETRNNRAIRCEACEPFKDVGVQDRVNRASGGTRRVEMWRFKLHRQRDITLGHCASGHDHSQSARRRKFEQSHHLSPFGQATP